MRLYDITLPVQPSLAAWPGDTPFGYRWNARKEADASVNLGALTMSAHTGTHVDAPFHFDDNGATIDTLDLRAFLGPAIVLHLPGRETIRCEDIPADLRQTPRVLFRTDAWPDPAVFPEKVPVLAPDVPAYLRARGVVLAGFDVPSVDRIDSKDLPIHHALAACGITILESLCLRDVPPGLYELLAAPLKLVGADAAPVRALLRSMETVLTP